MFLLNHSKMIHAPRPKPHMKDLMKLTGADDLINFRN